MDDRMKRVVRRFAATFVSAFAAQVLARLPELSTDITAHDALANILAVSALAAFLMAADKASREYQKGRG